MSTIITEVREQSNLQPDEDILHRGLGDFIASFESWAESADVPIPLGQNIVPAPLQGVLQVSGGGCLGMRVSTLSPFSSDVLKYLAPVVIRRDDYEM